jgi:glycosyltransferase involved in cell wall biosynthesis
MRVGIFFHNRLPVRKYGGTQRVIVWLARALRELGHDPCIITRPGTRLPEFRTAEVPGRIARDSRHDDGILLDPWLPRGLDVIHFFNQVAARTELPRLTTEEGNGYRGPVRPEHVFVSRDHMKRHGGLHFVYNGIDPDDYEFRPDKEDFLLFLARVRWKVKGVDRAERIAKAADRRLVIAGGRRFHFDRRIRSVGEVDDERKAHWLARARALLNPIRWDEPFGLNVTEALVSGCAVLASPLGSMPELVTPDVGFLCDSEEEFVDRIGDLDRIDPDACRARVLDRFTHIHMAEAYLRLYDRAIAGTLDAA